MLIPSIIFPNHVEPFGDVVFAPGVPWSFDDPGHQRVFRQMIERSGARVTFVQMDAAATSDANLSALDGSLADCYQQIEKATVTLAGFKATREAEIAKLTVELDDIKIEVRKQAADIDLGEAAPKDRTLIPEVQLNAFLNTSEGAGLKDQREWLDARIAKVKALIAAADDGSDSTMQVSQANTIISLARKRIKDVKIAMASAIAAIPATPAVDPIAVLAAFPDGALGDLVGFKNPDQILAAARRSLAGRPTSNGAAASTAPVL